MYVPPEAKLEKVCIKDDARYALANPFYDAEAKCIVATNGHALAIVPVEIHDSEQVSDGYIPVDALKESRRQKVLKGNLIVDDKTVKIVDGPTYDRPEGGQFPTWRKVYPSGSPVFALTINPQLLLNLAHAMGAGRKGAEFVTLFFSEDATGGPSNTTGIAVMGPNGAYGTIMPVWGDKAKEYRRPPFLATEREQAE